jgi:hypothetical protein
MFLLKMKKKKSSNGGKFKIKLISRAVGEKKNL